MHNDADTRKSECLYHYCSTESFLSILKHKSIILSLLRLSNDSMEGKLVSQAIMRLAERDSLDYLKKQKLNEIVNRLEDIFEGLGFCLSEKPDLLSQWRGYADGATGISIGFSKSYLEKLSEYHWKLQKFPGFKLYQVEYKPELHNKLVEPTYQEIRKLIEQGALDPLGIHSLLDVRTKEQIKMDDARIQKAHQELIIKLLDLFPTLFKLKSPAFEEEHEWRLVSIATLSGSEKCEFRSSNNRIIPYREYTLAAIHEDHPIKEIWLGPKHETPTKVIQFALMQAGFSDIPIYRSAATFR